MSAPFFGLKRSDSSASQGGRGRRLRADLHVHSSLSAGRVCGTGTVRRDAADPVTLYRAARDRGMDLVTLTDIDRIDGCLRILDQVREATDLFISEEIVARHPALPADLHVLVFGLNERQHREAQRLKRDADDLVRYLEGERLSFSLGPYAEALPADGDLARLVPVLRQFRCFEILNASEPLDYNVLAARLAQEAAAHQGYGVTAGSGACTTRGLGRGATAAEAAGADDFLRAVREGRTWPIRARPRMGRVGAVLGRLPIGAPTPGVRSYARRARLAARIRAARRRLDQHDVRTFREKTRAYRADPPGARRGGAGIGVTEAL